MTFNTVTGGTATTSYVTTATASTYLGTKPLLNWQSAWSSVSSTTQQKLLMEATRRVDAFPFQGKKEAPTQALQFPRAWFASSTIPTRLQNAVCEEAFSILNGGSQSKRDAQDGVASQSLGGESVTYNAKQRRLDSEEAYILLQPYIQKRLK